MKEQLGVENMDLKMLVVPSEMHEGSVSKLRLKTKKNGLLVLKKGWLLCDYVRGSTPRQSVLSSTVAKCVFISVQRC